ncbi:MAG: YcxB family protein [Christensenellales bacterium]|jgi:hypothetical protein
MSIEFTVTEQDFVNFNVYHYEHSKKMKRTVRRMQVVMAIALLIVFGYSGYTLGDSKGIVFFAVGVVATAVWIAFVPRYARWNIRRTARKMLKRGGDNGFFGRHTVTLEDDGIREISASSSAYTEYSSVERIGYGYGNYYVYTGALQAFIIPVSAFSGAEQRQAFLNLLSEKTGVALGGGAWD